MLLASMSGAGATRDGVEGDKGCAHRQDGFRGAQHQVYSVLSGDFSTHAAGPRHLCKVSPPHSSLSLRPRNVLARSQHEVSEYPGFFAPVRVDEHREASNGASCRCRSTSMMGRCNTWSTYCVQLALSNLNHNIDLPPQGVTPGPEGASTLLIFS